jgi:O-antigen/teichoic acid export membrane protein
MTAGVGSLVAEGNKEKIHNFFWQFLSFRIWLVSVFCFSFYILANPFIELWLGSEYILEHTPFILLTIYLFINQTRQVCETFLSAYGLYKDIWAPVVETVLNIGFSIWFGYLWGLSGILAGILISLLIIVVAWKPIFLFKNAFKISPLVYFRQYIKYLFFVGLSFFLTCKLGKVSPCFLLFVFATISLLLFIIFEKKILGTFLMILRKIK